MPKISKLDRERRRQMELAHSIGLRVTSDEAAELEVALTKNPNDVDCRLKLMGYYFRECHESQDCVEKRTEHILWMIRNMPDNIVLRWPGGNIEQTSNPNGYEKCKQLWLQQVACHKENVDVIINAARSLRFDFTIAEELYRKAIVLDPDASDWHRDLAWLLRRKANCCKPQDKVEIKKALEEMQEGLRKTKKMQSKRCFYDDMAGMAYDIEDWGLAKKMAQKSVSLARKYNDWYTGNAIHDGNCMLGRLALREKNVSKAAEYLRTASSTPGSPQLNSFGPNMQFAQEMLEIGQRDAVIDYLDGCKLFWDGKSKILDDYIEQIRQGKRPELLNDK